MPRRVQAALAAAVVVGWAAVAGAEPAAREPRIHGPYCTPAGCSGSGPSNALGMAGGFALAVLGALAVARRRGSAAV